ncbi:MAG TPA: carbohydrate kinase family protein [Candidatus Alectryocaccobium stercorigallinarum]|nr:carbohydrate kinase family protein [Candidatus Alectryocaccobium stercorigallinarum]
MDVLVLGAAVLDITAQPIEKDGHWAEKQRIEKIDFTVGGDAVNQCVRLADIGISAGIVSATGRDRNGEIIRTALMERKVDISHLLEKPDYPTGTSLILLDSHAERSIFSVRGGAYAALKKEDIKNVLPSGVKALSIASFFIEYELERDGGMEEILCEARKRGIRTFADLSHDKSHLGLDGIKRFLPYIDWFLPSIYDAEQMNKVKGAEANARAYKELGCKNVIIKCGAKGCYVLSEEFAGWIDAREIEPVDTTGAGDCMVALFIGALLKGCGVKEACCFACDGATYSTLFPGASTVPLTISAIEKWRMIQ